MRFRSILALVMVALAAYVLAAQERREPRAEPLPHTVAIELVLKTQQARIREVDRDGWLNDARERAWVVQRPFDPGIIDSTRMFNVSYRVDGKEVAAWLVDTVKGQVQPTDLRVKKL